jgi:hypothetical protein
MSLSQEQMARLWRTGETAMRETPEHETLWVMFDNDIIEKVRGVAGLHRFIAAEGVGIEWWERGLEVVALMHTHPGVKPESRAWFGPSLEDVKRARAYEQEGGSGVQACVLVPNDNWTLVGYDGAGVQWTFKDRPISPTPVSDASRAPEGRMDSTPLARSLDR